MKDKTNEQENNGEMQIRKRIQENIEIERNTIVVGKRQGNRSPGRPRQKWEGNIVIDL
jgi:hypothetical protein